MRLRPPGPPGRWTDAATGEYSDLLDYRTGAGTLGPALDEARAFLALPVVQRRNPGADRAHPTASWNSIAAARRLWRRCRVIGGTHAERYLCARGRDARRLTSLRFHPALAYQDESGRRRPFPALVAAVPALPGAAALSAGSLAALGPPPGAARLLIAADHDAVGRRAAATLEARALAQGIAATVLTPEGGDFNDDLAALGPQALVVRLAPLFGPGPAGAVHEAATFARASAVSPRDLIETARRLTESGAARRAQHGVLRPVPLPGRRCCGPAHRRQPKQPGMMSILPGQSSALSNPLTGEEG